MLYHQLGLVLNARKLILRDGRDHGRYRFPAVAADTQRFLKGFVGPDDLARIIKKGIGNLQVSQQLALDLSVSGCKINEII